MINKKIKTFRIKASKSRLKKKLKRSLQVHFKTVESFTEKTTVSIQQPKIKEANFSNEVKKNKAVSKLFEKTLHRRYNNKFKTKFKNKNRNRNKNKNKNKANAPLKGVVNIKSTFNNTLITFTNLKGKVVGWSSAGTQGFKGARKSTAYAAKTTATEAAKKAIDKGVNRAKVAVKGGGPGRDNSLRGLAETGLELAIIRDVTGLPHNGCRPRKKRRV